VSPLTVLGIQCMQVELQNGVLGMYCMQVELLNGGRDSVVIIVTRCEFERPGFETR